MTVDDWWLLGLTIMVAIFWVVVAWLINDAEKVMREILGDES